MTAGGSSGSAGTALGVGGSATGGAGGVGGSAAGASGGAAGVGGSATGARGGAGSGGSAAGSGGSTAGAGGSAAGTGGGAGGAGGSGDAPMPSAGCALAIAKPETFTSTSKFAVARSFPTSYDGVTPMPLIVGLHATSSTGSIMSSLLSNGQPGAERYVIAAPYAGNGAGLTFESVRMADVVSFVDDTLAELCVDRHRIFGAGNGSGGRVLIQLADELIRTSSLRFRAMGVVGTFYGGGHNPYPTIFIHPLSSLNSRGVAQDEDGTKALQLFLTRNACGTTSTPVSVAGCASNPSVTPGCVDFDGCSAPLRWCHHNENVTVGDPWPCFATAAIYQFFEPYLGGARAP
jgi:hypothetical protein